MWTATNTSRQGDVLVVLTNQELEHELADLKLAIAQSQLKRRVHQQQRELAKATSRGRDTAARSRVGCAEKQIQVAHLVVCAPCSGQVIGRNLQALRGRYLERGSDLLAIGNEAAKEVRLSIAQQDIDAFRGRLDVPLRAYLPGCTILQAPLTKIEPRASTLPLDASLCAPHGGPLPVRRSSDSARQADTRTSSNFSRRDSRAACRLDRRRVNKFAPGNVPWWPCTRMNRSADISTTRCSELGGCKAVSPPACGLRGIGFQPAFSGPDRFPACRLC